MLRGGIEGGTLLRLAAIAAGPRIRFSESQAEVDLGLMAVGMKADKQVTFTNEGLIPCSWELRPMADPSVEDTPDATTSTQGAGDEGLDSFQIERPRCRLSCWPQTGTLEPGQSVTASVVCEAGKQPERIRRTIECLVAGTGDLQHSTFQPQHISLRGEVNAHSHPRAPQVQNSPPRLF